MMKSWWFCNVIMCCFISRCVSGYSFAYFYQKRIGQYITSHNLTSREVVSEMHCAASCLTNPYCSAISYECQAITTSDKGLCHLQLTDDPSDPYRYGNDTTMCSMIVNQRSPPPLHISGTTATSTAASQNIQVTSSDIIDISNNFQHHCSNNYDIGVITHDKIYFYEDMNSLSSPPCDVITDVKSYFNGFPDLPDPDKWDCIMTFQRGNIDVFSGGKVWRWMIGIKQLWYDGHYPKFFANYMRDTFGSVPSVTPSRPIWSVYMSRIASMNMYFYNEDGNYYLYRMESPFESVFTSNTTLLNPAGWSLNPWTDILGNVVGVAYVDEEDYVLITSDHQVYFIDLDFTVFNNVPKTTQHHIGQIVFS